MKIRENEAYSVFAQYYDEVMDEVPYDEWVDYLERILAEMGYRPKTVLDLACGTGNMSLRLARRGYKVQGIDGSAAMVEVARKKGLAQQLLIPFQQGDFRTFQLAEPVDLVISLYDSFNYLLQEEDLAQAFRQVYQAVRPGGYFIFDLNTILRLTSIEEGNSMVEGDGWYCFWRDVVEPVGPYWKVELTFFEEARDGSMYRDDEVHVERGYPIARVRELLVGAGFRVEQVYEAFGLESGSEESERVYWVCRKEE